MEIKQSWYDKLSDNFDALMRKFDMPEDMQIEIREFMLSVAKEQYKSGNRSGIAWLRKKLSPEANAELSASFARSQAAGAAA